MCRRAGVNLGLIAGALGDIKKIRRLDQLAFAIKDMLTLLDNVQAMKDAGRHAKRKVLRGRSLLLLLLAELNIFFCWESAGDVGAEQSTEKRQRPHPSARGGIVGRSRATFRANPIANHARYLSQAVWTTPMLYRGLSGR